MKWFHNMKINAKMLLGFFVVIALMVALAVFAVVQMSAVNEVSTYVSHFADSREREMLVLRTNVLDLRRVVATITMNVPLNDSERIYPLIAEADANYDSCMNVLDKYDDLVKSDPRFSQAAIAERLEATAGIRQVLKQYRTEVFEIIAEKSLEGDYNGTVEVTLFGAGIISKMWDEVTHLTEYAAATSKASSKELSDMATRAEALILVIAVIGAAIAACIALYVARLISKPLTRLSTFMKKAGTTGNITLRHEEAETMDKLGQNKDEIGITISSAIAFVNHVSRIDKEMKSVAGGDLTGDIEPKSEEDTMGISLKKMVDNLNGMFGEIHTSTGEVTSGSKQVAEGALHLAQGSTEQAATIQQLTGTIAEIAVRTEENARTAGKASELSSTIKENAEKGCRQMDDMIEAVKDINNSSNSISKIIKTIDDIAFQTNILALNAAVEAARAGHHGKGFAVVAEEVRNLASKSAEAAKDTGTMIQDSMEKTQLGSRIAGETAASLNDIVSGINESARLIDEITSASEHQSYSVSQIKTEIDQVAYVIQQNSATAEESAAASEEMSSQSDMLQQLVAQFRLKEDAIKHHNLHAHEGPRQKVHAIAGSADYDVDKWKW